MWSRPKPLHTAAMSRAEIQRSLPRHVQQHPSTPPPPFQEDIFYHEYVDLGDVSEVELEHDNSGPGPGWHLQV